VDLSRIQVPRNVGVASSDGRDTSSRGPRSALYWVTDRSAARPDERIRHSERPDGNELRVRIQRLSVR